MKEIVVTTRFRRVPWRGGVPSQEIIGSPSEYVIIFPNFLGFNKNIDPQQIPTIECPHCIITHNKTIVKPVASNCCQL